MTEALLSSVLHLHSRQRGATASVERQRKKQFVETKWFEAESKDKGLAAAQWEAERSKLPQAGDASDEVAADDEGAPS